MEALLYFALWAGLILLMMRFGCGAHVMGHGHGQHGAQGKDNSWGYDQLRWVPPKTDVDPVCGKTVHTQGAKSAVHDGMVYYFCSRECREQFEAAPHLYVGAQAHPQSKQMDHAHG
jgi:YHS domain-containing protein